MTATQGRIGYVAPMIDYPKSAVTDPDKHANMLWDWREVTIGNGRDIPGGATLCQNGFTVLPHRSAVEVFTPGTEWIALYAAEIVAAIKALTGAADVVVASMTLEDGSKLPAVRYASTNMIGRNGAVDFCHNDYTAASVGRYIAELDPERADERISKRFAFYNTWRLVSPPPQSKPLAICDPNSIAVADLVPGDTYHYNEIYRQNALFRYNPNHRWFYFPDLNRDEMIVFAGYDSDPAYPSIVPHCAFDNPDCKNPEAVRISVDCRAFVFFG